MDSSGDESFVWSRGSQSTASSEASSEGADADKLLEDAVKAEKGMKGKKSIKKEKVVKDEKAIKTELLEGAQSPADEKKCVKKARVKRESASSVSDGDTKPTIDKFSADETAVETRRPRARRSTRPSTGSDSDHRNDTRRPRRSTGSDSDHRNDTRRPRRSTGSDSDHRNDTRRPRRSTGSDSDHHNNTRRPRRSTGSDSDHRNDTRRPRRSTGSVSDDRNDTRRPRRSTGSVSDDRNDTRRPRRSTGSDSDYRNDTRRPRRSTGSDSDHRNDTRRPRRSTGSDSDHRNDTRRPRRSTGSDSDHRNDTRRPRRSTGSDSDHRSDTRRPRRSTRRSTDTDTGHPDKKSNKSPKVSPNKPFTSKEYRSDSSASDDDNVKQNGTASDCTRPTARVNGHRDSESSTNTRAQINKDRTILISTKSRRNTISKRIQFEDEEGSASESQHQQREQTERPEQANKVSSRVQRHLKANPLLKQVAVTATASAWPGPDDELWWLHTPTDFDEQTLKGATLTLDDKCKVKVDGQTYEGKSEGDRPRRVTLLTHRDGCVIENVALVNSVRFRRKNPRPRVIEDDGHNESEAIPMPVTKRRHPLFGADYKKAIKLPSAVRKKLKAKTSSMEADVDETMEVDAVARMAVQPLQTDAVARMAVQPLQTDAQAQGDSDKRKKRKRKKDRDSDIASAATTSEPDHGGGAKRRRKHRDTEWDSEKAIEESLFNF